MRWGFMGQPENGVRAIFRLPLNRQQRQPETQWSGDGASPNGV
ncbi:MULTISPECIES: hypothetical protein [Kingella]|nr:MULTISPECIES: hypothetical protein [Kingella]